MTFAEDAVEATQTILSVLGDDGIELYPVQAARVAAWLAAGNVPVDLSLKAVVDFQAIENDEGDVSIDNERMILVTDEQTVQDSGINRRSCIGFKGKLYDIVRILTDDPGAKNCYLRELVV